MTRRLRIAHLVVQPVLVWDDGEEMTAGPALNPVTLPLSQVAHLVETLPAEVATLAEKLTDASAHEGDPGQ